MGVAQSDCRLLALDAAEFQGVASAFPTDCLRTYAKEFVEEMNKLPLRGLSDLHNSKIETKAMSKVLNSEVVAMIGRKLKPQLSKQSSLASLAGGWRVSIKSHLGIGGSVSPMVGSKRNTLQSCQGNSTDPQAFQGVCTPST